MIAPIARMPARAARSTGSAVPASQAIVPKAILPVHCQRHKPGRRAVVAAGRRSGLADEPSAALIRTLACLRLGMACTRSLLLGPPKVVSFLASWRDDQEWVGVLPVVAAFRHRREAGGSAPLTARPCRTQSLSARMQHADPNLKCRPAPAFETTRSLHSFFDIAVTSNAEPDRRQEHDDDQQYTQEHVSPLENVITRPPSAGGLKIAALCC